MGSVAVLVTMAVRCRHGWCLFLPRALRGVHSLAKAAHLIKGEFSVVPVHHAQGTEYLISQLSPSMDDG